MRLVRGSLSAVFKHDKLIDIPYLWKRKDTFVAQDIYKFFAGLLQRVEQFLKAMSPLARLFLNAIPPLARLFLSYLPYTVEAHIFSPATEVIFTRSKRTHQKICLKLWQPWKDELYDTQDIAKCTEYLLEGLVFNRRFAPKVYLGIAPIKPESQGEIKRGQLITHPEKRNLNLTVPYALVMKRLRDKQRLDNQLQHVYQKTRSPEKFMRFLATNVADMHTQVAPSTLTFGTPDSIMAKLLLNKTLFVRTLKQLADAKMINKIGQYEPVIEILEKAFVRYSADFETRFKEGYIKRCHGDLKATNLWISHDYPLIWRKRLLALDCIDFRPEFCHIDTLSDVAMLAIDLEMHLSSLCKEKAWHYTQYFLEVYMKHAKDDKQVSWALLEYYLTEKAMVFACISTLYDKRPLSGKQYLDTALLHAQKLADLLAPPNIAASSQNLQVYPNLVGKA